MITYSRFKIQGWWHSASLVAFIIATSMGCQPAKEKTAQSQFGYTRYAKGFSVETVGENTLVKVNYPYQNATSGYSYLLVPKGKTAPAHDANTQVVYIPIERIVCTSTTHIPLLDYIDQTQSLIGFPTTDYISSEKMRKRVDAGLVKDLGIDKGMDLEALVTLRPDLVMGYTMGSDLGQLKKIQELNIPVVINAEYLERHPLGRAEWIKFMALFFGKERQADSVFNSIEKQYLQTAQLASEAMEKPTVLCGVLYGDGWFLPGGENYASRILRDAGCSYLWAADSSHGFLQLSFETVYTKAKNADLWIGVAAFKSMQDLRAAEDRYALFAPFQKGNVYSYDARHGAKGGSEFLELGYLRPDLVLKDLVKIAHPEALPNHHLFFYQRLN